MSAADAIMSVPLTKGEEFRLDHLEGVVEQGMATFVHVGQALAAIRDGRLYRATHDSFATYVKDRFGLSRAHAYRQMDAAEIAAIVSPIGDNINEAQARELVGLEPEQAREVFAQAVAETAGRPTARAVRDARETIAAPSGDTSQRSTQRPRRKPLSDEYRRAIGDLERVYARLSRLHQDDRFTANRQARQPWNLGRLRSIAEGLADLRDDLSGSTVTQPVMEMEFSTAVENPVVVNICAVCSERLDPVLVELGESVHPSCEAES